MKKEDLVKYENGEIIYYDISDGFVRRGAIRGQSDIGNPVIGVSYIIEDLSGDFPNPIYQFKFLTLPEVFITRNHD